MDKLINEFCYEQLPNTYSAGTRFRKSVLLQLRDDIDYNLGIHRIFKKLNLSRGQSKTLQEELTPLFVVPLLYFSAIDLFARVKFKQSSRKGLSKDYFKKSALEFFKHSSDEADKLWGVRNSLSHQYSITEYVSKMGGSKVIDLSKKDVVISVRPMRSSLEMATRQLSEYLMSEKDPEKKMTEKFIESYGFIYYLIY